MANKQIITEAQAVVPLPSADLIKYRFDLIDEKFAHLDRKLDTITNTFFSKEEALALKEEHILRFREIDDKFKSLQWYWRAVVSAVLIALAASMFNLLVRTKL